MPPSTLQVVGAMFVIAGALHIITRREAADAHRALGIVGAVITLAGLAKGLN